MTGIIHTEKLAKRFPGHKKDEAVDAVRDLDLDVAKGEIFGLLGPNGAGKTTAMRMLCTLLVPSGGKATVAGYDLMTQAHEIRRHIGYVGQKGGMEQVATGRENLLLHAQLYRMSKAEASRRIDALIDRLKLSAFADRKTETYSGGQRRIFDLASGIINSPALRFLDEPSTGLDPQSRARVWDEVKALHEQGTSIFLTTHYLEEADALCDRVAIVDLGRMVALGTPAELKKQIAGDIVTISYDAPEGAQRAATLLDGNRVVLERQAIENGHLLFVDKGDEALPVILRILGQGGAAPKSVHLSRPSLDDVFLKLTGRSMRDTGEGQH
ncbi:MAG TPA: ATP-binding cassette domain-containing protein [Stellaceae bacterium]|jgi:ABC-2 type transport system ATP-binding protein|nr:ATP-binding cassette domain-containing protein [Stellaceae bacterium]